MSPKPLSLTSDDIHRADLAIIDGMVVVKLSEGRTTRTVEFSLTLSATAALAWRLDNQMIEFVQRRQRSKTPDRPDVDGGG